MSDSARKLAWLQGYNNWNSNTEVNPYNRNDPSTRDLYNAYEGGVLRGRDDYYTRLVSRTSRDKDLI
jgi:hypothetical protein